MRQDCETTDHRDGFGLEPNPYRRFSERLADGDVLAALRGGLVGGNVMVDGPFGARKLVYADYVASGRALRQVEAFILDEVLPTYANSHTESSFCGARTTRLREEARKVVARGCGASPEHAVIFAGAGATAGLNRLVHLLGVDVAVRRGETPLVLVGPYEHHSNLLPWRESGAKVVEIAEAPEGGPDLAMIADVLAAHRDTPLKIGAFSAASNVTGIVSDVVAVTTVLKAHGALAVWDYAGGGPYLPIRMDPAPGLSIDAIALSPHKFLGGPGASGVLVIRRDALAARTPSWPGGGTVKFVSSLFHDYSDTIEDREEAGTPNILGDIRAALAFLVKEAVGVEYIERRDRELTERAFARWQDCRNLDILAPHRKDRLPIFSFRVRDGAGGFVHQQTFTRMLSDAYGIQTRGGCVCAGPYAHRLLAIDDGQSAHIRERILAGDEREKPGFVRLNLSFLMDDATVDFILDSVADLATRSGEYAGFYGAEPEAAACRLV